MKINYIIATYSNPNKKEFYKNINKLKMTLNYLEEFKHQIFQITIVVAINFEDDDIDYINYLKSIENKYEIIYKQNDVWLSYSSYYEAFKKFPNFDYYIMTEDDYYFCIDNFDKILINLLKNNDILFIDIAEFQYIEKRIIQKNINKLKKKCYKLNKKKKYIYEEILIKHPFANHAICISTKNILEKVYENFYDKMKKTNRVHQVAYSNLFFNENLKIIDIKNTNYKAEFYETTTNEISYFGNLNGKLFLKTIQGNLIND